MTILWCIHHQSLEDKNLAGDLSLDLTCTDQWQRNCFATFTASQTNLVMFHHQKANPKLCQDMIKGFTLNGDTFLEHLLKLNLILDLK